MGKDLLPHNVCLLKNTAASNFGALILVETSYRFKSEEAAAQEDF